MQRHAAILSQYYPHFPHASFFVAGIVEQLIRMLMDREAGWHSKVEVLPILQVLYFLHLPLIDDSLETKVMDCVSSLLIDSQVEVRDAAAVTLTGLIRCSQGNSIHSLLGNLRKSLEEVPSLKKKRTRQAEVSDQAKRDMESSLIRKHSIVLGLSSIVLAFPVRVFSLT